MVTGYVYIQLYIIVRSSGNSLTTFFFLTIINLVKKEKKILFKNYKQRITVITISFTLLEVTFIYCKAILNKKKKLKSVYI